MVGGSAANVKKAMPIFDALRPEGPRDEGFVHAGKVGAGHYTKMVHNGIEYGLMHAYAEGYELLEKKDIVENVPGAFKAWSRGTVVRSWLLDLMVKALEENPSLEDVSDYTADSGEGRWTVEEAIALSVPMPVISASLFARFASRQQSSPTHAGRRRAAWPVRRAPGHVGRRGRRSCAPRPPPGRPAPQARSEGRPQGDADRARPRPPRPRVARPPVPARPPARGATTSSRTGSARPSAGPTSGTGSTRKRAAKKS